LLLFFPSNFTHSDRSIIIPYCVINLHFSYGSWWACVYLWLFHLFIGNCVFYSGKCNFMSLLIFWLDCLFFIQLTFERSIHISVSISKYSLCYLFSQPIGWTFILLTGSLQGNLFNLEEVQIY
jgi:hypothetical protein